MKTPHAAEPFSERQVTPDIVAGHFETTAPQGAFGGVSSGVEEKEHQAASLAERLQDNADTYQVNKAMNAFTVQKAAFLGQANMAKDEEAAAYAPDNENGLYKPWIEKTSKDTLGYAQNSRQQKMINEKLDQQNSDLNLQLQRNTAVNLYKGNLKQADSAIQGTIDGVSQQPYVDLMLKNRTNLDEQVKTATRIRGDYQDTAKDGGPVYQKNLVTQQSTYDKTAITQLLGNGDVTGARKYVEYLKQNGQADDQHLGPLVGKVHEAGVKQDATNWFYKNGPINKNTNGSINRAALDANIDRMDLSFEDKKNFKSTVDSLVGGQQKDWENNYKDKWQGFKGEAAKMTNNFSKAADPVKIQALAQKYGVDQADIYTKEKWVQSQYKSTGGLTLNFGSPSQQTAHYMDIREAVNLGQIGNIQELRDIYDQGGLTAKQFDKLQGEYFNASTKDPQSATKMTLRRVKAMGNDVFGDDVTGNKNYMDYMLDKSNKLGENDDSRVLIKDAQEYLKSEKPRSSDVWKAAEGRTYGPGQITPDQVRSLYTDYGKNVTDAVSQSLASNLKRPPTVFEINDFVNSLGGPEAFQRFKPANNAVMSIIKWNEEHPNNQPIPLNKDRVDAALQRHPNGVF